MAGQNRWRHLTVAGNLERSFVPVPGDVGLREAVSHLARGDLREEGRRGSGRRAHSENRRWWRFQLSKKSLDTNGSLLTFGLSSAVEIPVTVPSIVGRPGVAEKKVRNESRPERPQVFWTAISTSISSVFFPRGQKGLPVYRWSVTQGLRKEVRSKMREEFMKVIKASLIRSEGATNTEFAWWPGG